MKKNLEKLIKTYSLGNLVVESAWTIRNNSLYVKFADTDINIRGLAKLENIVLPDVQFAVTDTKEFLSGIAPLNDDATMNVNYGRKNVEFIEKTSKTKNIRPIGDVDILEMKSPNPENSFNFEDEMFDVEFELNELFYTNLNKINKISSENFGIQVTSPNTADIIINYSTINDSYGMTQVDIKKGMIMHQPILYNFKSFMSILSAIKGMEATVKMSSELGVVEFKAKSDEHELAIVFYMLKMN